MPRKKKTEATAAAAPKRVIVARTKIADQETAVVAGNLDTFIDSFNKRMRNKDGSPRAQILRASDYELPFMTKRLPTGILTLDVELHGGFPAGGVSQIAGPKNSTKSWIAWQVIRQQQHFKGNKFRALLAMTEMRADRGQARLAGVTIALGKTEIDGLEMARISHGKPAFTQEEREEMMKEIGEIHELHADSGETFYDAILDAVRRDAYDLILIDSFGSILTAAEAEGETLADKHRGGSAKINSDFLRILNSLLTMSYKDPETGKLRTRDVCIIGINQVRDNMNSQTSKWQPFITTGGRALEHAKFVDLWVFSTTQKWEKDKYTGADVMVGKDIRWEIQKGKAGIHEGAHGRYFYDFRMGTADLYDDMVTAGIQGGVIELSGAWLSLSDPDDKALLVKEQGRGNFIQRIFEDVNANNAAGTPENSLFNLVRDEVIKRNGIDVRYDW